MAIPNPSTISDYLQESSFIMGVAEIIAMICLSKRRTQDQENNWKFNGEELREAGEDSVLDSD